MELLQQRREEFLSLIRELNEAVDEIGRYMDMLQRNDMLSDMDLFGDVGEHKIGNG